VSLSRHCSYFIGYSDAMTKIIINTDGGSRGNPGISGAGWVIREGDKVLKENSVFLGEHTNNWAEYEAVYLALKDLKRKLGKKVGERSVEIRMDSELVVKQLRGEYKIKEETLYGQFIKIHNMRVKDFPNLTFVHIPREENADADQLANEAMGSGTGNLL